MNIAKVFLSTLMILTALKTSAQSDDKNRGLLQQEFIAAHFIMPHLNASGNLKITSTQTIDSLFTAINKEWVKVAPDTLHKYKLNMPLDDFKHIDAYSYFWTLVSMSQNINLPTAYQKHLVVAYMIPAMQFDLSTLKKRPDLTSLHLVHSGTLQNTIAIGSESEMGKETVLLIYQMYAAFNDILKSFAERPDTAMSNYAKDQLKGIERFKYDLEAKFNYYNGNKDESLNNVLTGLVTNAYPRSRVFGMASLLLKDFNRSGKKDKSLKLLNALMLNTTADNINRDSLLNWYVKIDPVNGRKTFDNILNNMSGSFKKAERTVELPEKWNFIANSIDPERIKKVKYYLLDVWYTSCGPCIFEIPGLNTFYEKFKNRDDVQFISINTDFTNGKLDETYVSKRSEELGIKFPVVYDNAASNISGKLSVTSFPSKFIIDNKGQIMAKLDNSTISLEAFDMFIRELK